MTRPVAGVARPEPRSGTSVPGIDTRRLRRHALLAFAALLGLAAAAALLPVPTMVVATAVGRTHAEPTLVRHSEAGVVAKLHVREGDDVVQGARLLSFDTRLLDSQMAGIRRQIDGSRLHIEGLKEEAGGLAKADRSAPQRQRLSAIEAQIAAAEQEVLGLEVRLAMASEERGRTEVRAPLAGRVAKLFATEAAGIASGTALVAIQPAPDRLMLETTLALDRRVPLQIGHAVEIRESAGGVSRLFAPWSRGRVDAITGEDGRGVHLRLVAELADAEADTRERTFNVRLVSGASTLLSRFADALAAPAQATPHVRNQQVTP